MRQQMHDTSEANRHTAGRLCERQRKPPHQTGYHQHTMVNLWPESIEQFGIACSELQATLSSGNY